MIKDQGKSRNLWRHVVVVFVQRLKGKLPKRALDVLFSAAGFLLALGINSWIGGRHDQDTYKSMIKAVQTEADSNKSIMEKSYGAYFYSGGLILKDFSVVVVSQSLANPLFVSHARTADLSLLNQYARDVTLANSYRRVTETITFSAIPDQGQESWKEAIKTQWRPTVNDVEKDIGLILKINGGRPSMKIGLSDVSAPQPELDSVKIVSISPNTAAPLRVGQKMAIRVEAEYNLRSAESGQVTLLIQKGVSGSPPIAMKDEAIKKGTGRVILNEYISVPNTNALQVFTPLYGRGATSTNTADFRSYKVQVTRVALSPPDPESPQRNKQKR